MTTNTINVANAYSDRKVAQVEVPNGVVAIVTGTFSATVLYVRNDGRTSDLGYGDAASARKIANYWFARLTRHSFTFGEPSYTFRGETFEAPHHFMGWRRPSIEIGEGLRWAETDAMTGAAFA